MGGEDNGLDGSIAVSKRRGISTAADTGIVGKLQQVSSSQ